MPELPEVETVRRGLAPVFAKARFVRVEQRRPDLRFALPERFAERLLGQQVLHLDRRAKYLLAALSSGEVLLMHLGMSGRFTISQNNAGPTGKKAQRRAKVAHAKGGTRHDHVVFHLASGARVTYNDPRRFGFMLLGAAREIHGHPLLAGLGVEPLGPELTADYLASRARGKALSLKAFLLDQRIVAGLGNIYVSEALHRARLSPRRRAASLARNAGGPTRRAVSLVEAIRSVLKDAIAAGGSSLRDYRHADGSLGDFQHAFRVYGREGERCPRPGCSGLIRRDVQSGRSTYFCDTCQR